MKTEAWWVCVVCGLKLNKVGRKKPKDLTFLEHRKTCPNAGGMMKQIPQQKKNKK